MSDDQAVQHSDDGISEGAYGANMQLQPRCNAGSEHIGCLIGKRFSGKMYLGQCIAWLPAGSAENHYGILVGQDEYKVIFHDNDVHLLSHVDLLECKKNVKSSLTTARNLKALKGYVEVWQRLRPTTESLNRLSLSAVVKWTTSSRRHSSSLRPSGR